MENYRVKTVSEFINVVENIGMGNYIYRGQIHPYFQIEASGFRPYKGGWLSDKIYDMEKLKKEFYRRVLNGLSEEEKQHFSAYCQHHGVPTNLVDFSYSPLVALFFSCDGKEELSFKLSELIGQCSIDELANDKRLKEMLIHNLIVQSQKDFYSEYGQVYLIKRSRLIDITDIIVDLKGCNIFERMLVDREVMRKFGYKIVNHFEKISSEDAIKYIINIIATYKNNSVDFCKQIYKEKKADKNIFYYANRLKEGNSYEVINELYEFVRRELDDEEIIYDLDFEDSKEGKIYFWLFYNLVYMFKQYPNKYIWTLDFYFTYTPPNLFLRLEKQQGLFIYQPYLYTNDEIYGYKELTIQRICPDITIEIENYNAILKELNCLGIDVGFLYGDIDSIAKTVSKVTNVDDMR